MNNCIFCRIIKKDQPANIIFEDKDLIVILDIDPISEGHCLVIPKSEAKDLFELGENLAGKIMDAASRVGNAIEKAYNYDGIMITSVSGEFQDVPHFHLHVFGRKRTNDIKMIYPENTGNENPKTVVEKLKNAL